VCICTADKNFSPNATDEFRRVTTAFEILGDPVNRKRYDRAIKEEEAKKRRSSSHNQYRQSHQKQSSTSSRKPNNMDRKSQQKQQRQSEMRNKSKAAQSRLLKITTKAEFETTMLDPSKKYYRTNCLILFVSNKQAEKWAETQLYFPYPFVGSDAGYEKILNVGKVRRVIHHRYDPELFEHFRTPYSQQHLSVSLTCLGSSSTHKRSDSTPRRN
jgi:curved DNA-binding protein CbpA